MLDTDADNPRALVSADWLSAHLDDPAVRVVEVDVSPASYNKGHIPGAVFWNIYSDLKDPSYRLFDGAAIERLFSNSGIEPQTRVILYGYGPALGYWLLKLYRHADASVLNTSKQQWHEEGRAWAMERAEPKATTYHVPPPDERIRAAAAEVAALCGVADCAILDVRSVEEFKGDRFWPSGAAEGAGRPGHIPGAMHVPLDTLTNPDGSFAHADDLRRAFPPNLTAFREVVTYCTIGNRASVAWFVLTELLGHSRIRVYDGSWAEWGLMPSTPVER